MLSTVLLAPTSRFAASAVAPPRLGEFVGRVTFEELVSAAGAPTCNLSALPCDTMM
jgi:hypothetical protein